jgi:hypothetical protein
MIKLIIDTSNATNEELLELDKFTSKNDANAAYST